MSRPVVRGRAAKRELSEADVGNSDQEEQSIRASTGEIDEVVQQTHEVQVRETRLEEELSSTPKAEPNVNSRRTTRKRQKIGPMLESEFVEIEYVDQMRHNFSPRNGLSGDLPPIHDLKQIFEQVTLHAVHEDGFKDFLESLNGRELRVATVCSGTESPILALEMVVSREYSLEDSSV